MSKHKIQVSKQRKSRWRRNIGRITPYKLLLEQLKQTSPPLDLTLPPPISSTTPQNSNSKKKKSGDKPLTSKGSSFLRKSKLVSDQIDIPSYTEYIFKNGKYYRSDLAHYTSDKARAKLISQGVLYSNTVEGFFKKIANSEPQSAVEFMSGSLNQTYQQPDTLYLATDASLKLYTYEEELKPLSFNINYFGFVLALNGKVRTLETKFSGKNRHSRHRIGELELRAIKHALTYLEQNHLAEYPHIKQAILYTDQQNCLGVLNSSKEEWESYPSFQAEDVKALITTIRNLRDKLESEGLNLQFQYTKSHHTNYLHNLIDATLSVKQSKYKTFIFKKLRNPYYRPLNSERTYPDLEGKPTR